MQNRIEFNDKLLFPTISLFVADSRVGRASVGLHLGETVPKISLARLDVNEDEQRKGYGSMIMDFILDLCLKKGCYLTIEVDPPQSKTNNPLQFYQKYFDKRNIPYVKEWTHATMFFGCQCALKVVPTAVAVSMEKEILAIQPHRVASKQLLAEYNSECLLPYVLSTDAIKVAAYYEKFMEQKELPAPTLPQVSQPESPVHSSVHCESKVEKIAKTKNKFSGPITLFGNPDPATIALLVTAVAMSAETMVANIVSHVRLPDTHKRWF